MDTATPAPETPLEILRELERLEREVLERAKEFKAAWRTWLERQTEDGRIEALNAQVSEKRIQLCDAVEALERFESKQEQVR